MTFRHFLRRWFKFFRTIPWGRLLPVFSEKQLEETKAGSRILNNLWKYPGSLLSSPLHVSHPFVHILCRSSLPFIYPHFLTFLLSFPHQQLTPLFHFPLPFLLLCLFFLFFLLPLVTPALHIPLPLCLLSECFSFQPLPLWLSSPQQLSSLYPSPSLTLLSAP